MSITDSMCWVRVVFSWSRIEGDGEDAWGEYGGGAAFSCFSDIFPRVIGGLLGVRCRGS